MLAVLFFLIMCRGLSFTDVALVKIRLKINSRRFGPGLHQWNYPANSFKAKNQLPLIYRRN